MKYSFEIYRFQNGYTRPNPTCVLQCDPFRPSPHSNNRFFPPSKGGALALPSPNRPNDRPERTRRFDVHSRRVLSFIRVELITVQQVGIFPRHRTTRAVQTSLISSHFFKNTIFIRLPHE